MLISKFIYNGGEQTSIFMFIFIFTLDVGTYFPEMIMLFIAENKTLVLMQYLY